MDGIKNWTEDMSREEKPGRLAPHTGAAAAPSIKL